MEIPSEVIYTACGTLGTAIVALWRRQVASEKRCQRENEQLAERLRQIEDYQRDKLYGLLTKATLALKAHGVEVDETPRVGHRHNGASFAILLLLPLLLLLAGCGVERQPMTPEAAAAYASSSKAEADAARVEAAAAKKRAAIAEQAAADEAKSIDQLKHDQATDRGLIKEAQDDIAAKQKLITAKQEEHWATLVYIAAGVLALAGLALGVAAFFVPLARGRLVALAIGCACLAAVCIWLGQHIHLVLVAVPFLVAIAAAVVVMELRRHATGTAVMGEEWVRYAKELRAFAPQVAKQLDEASRGLQGKSAGFIDRVLDRVKGT